MRVQPTCAACENSSLSICPLPSVSKRLNTADTYGSGDYGTPGNDNDTCIEES